MIEITNIWTIIVAVIASFVLGWIWYGPLFGKIWMQSQTIDHMKAEAMKKGMVKSAVTQLIATIISVIVFTSLASALSLVGFGALAGLAFWIWLGFIASVTIGTVVWEGKSWSFFFVLAGYNLVSLLITSLVISIIG
jgi:hypothetical protein